MTPQVGLGFLFDHPTLTLTLGGLGAYGATEDVLESPFASRADVDYSYHHSEESH